MSAEKAPGDLESQTRSTSSSGTLPVNNHKHSIEKPRSIASSDYSHEDVEAMDAGHQRDLEIQRVSMYPNPINAFLSATNTTSDTRLDKIVAVSRTRKLEEIRNWRQQNFAGPVTHIDY